MFNPPGKPIHGIVPPPLVKIVGPQFAVRFIAGEHVKDTTGLDQGIGHFMLFEVGSEARAPAPPMPKSRQTSSVASDRKSAPQPLFRQAA
jgi:hypothetical protein